MVICLYRVSPRSKPRPRRRPGQRRRQGLRPRLPAKSTGVGLVSAKAHRVELVRDRERVSAKRVARSATLMATATPISFSRPATKAIDSGGGAIPPAGTTSPTSPGNATRSKEAVFGDFNGTGRTPRLGEIANYVHREPGPCHLTCRKTKNTEKGDFYVIHGPLAGCRVAAGRSARAGLHCRGAGTAANLRADRQDLRPRVFPRSRTDSLHF